jgi:hypothetical protein
MSEDDNRPFNQLGHEILDLIFGLKDGSFWVSLLVHITGAEDMDPGTCRTWFILGSTVISPVGKARQSG